MPTNFVAPIPLARSISCPELEHTLFSPLGLQLTRSTFTTPSPITSSSSHQLLPPAPPQLGIRVYLPNSVGEILDDSATAPSTKRRNARRLCEDENYIPRPPNAFMCFRRQYTKGTDLVSRKGSGDTISRRVSQLWKDLLPGDRKMWYELAEKVKLEHQRRYPSYKYQPTRRTSNKGSKASTEPAKRCTQKSKRSGSHKTVAAAPVSDISELTSSLINPFMEPQEVVANGVVFPGFNIIPPTPGFPLTSGAPPPLSRTLSAPCMSSCYEEDLSQPAGLIKRSNSFTGLDSLDIRSQWRPWSKSESGQFYTTQMDDLYTFSDGTPSPAHSRQSTPLTSASISPAGSPRVLPHGPREQQLLWANSANQAASMNTNLELYTSLVQGVESASLTPFTPRTVSEVEASLYPQLFMSSPTPSYSEPLMDPFTYSDGSNLATLSPSNEGYASDLTPIDTLLQDNFPAFYA